MTNSQRNINFIIKILQPQKKQSQQNITLFLKSMLGLGKQVLSKIQNLLIEIDRKNEKKQPKQTKKVSQSKSNTKRKNNEKSPMKKSNYHKKSVAEEEINQNIGTSRVQQLYLNHFIRQRKLLDRNLSNLEEERRQMKSFKVENKTSQFLNQKKSLKPIYQRTNEILLKRQKSIQKIKQLAPKSQRQIEQEEAERILEQKKKKYPKLTKEEFDQRMQQLQKRNMMRLQRIQKKKLYELQQRNSSFREKPQINAMNQSWWQKKKLKKNLSNNVFERFQQYDMQRKQQWAKYLQKRKQQQTPFTPRLSQATREIARKSQSRRSLYENMSRSNSCNTLSKCQESIFMDRGESPSISRSLSRTISSNIKHGKSSTTMHSSRNANIEKKNW